VIDFWIGFGCGVAAMFFVSVLVSLVLTRDVRRGPSFF
jgi:hypothetical protein